MRGWEHREMLNQAKDDYEYIILQERVLSVYRNTAKGTNFHLARSEQECKRYQSCFLNNRRLFLNHRMVLDEFTSHASEYQVGETIKILGKRKQVNHELLGNIGQTPLSSSC